MKISNANQQGCFAAWVRHDHFCSRVERQNDRRDCLPLTTPRTTTVGLRQCRRSLHPTQTPLIRVLSSRYARPAYGPRERHRGRRLVRNKDARSRPGDQPTAPLHQTSRTATRSGPNNRQVAVIHGCLFSSSSPSHTFVTRKPTSAPAGTVTCPPPPQPLPCSCTGHL